MGRALILLGLAAAVAAVAEPTSPQRSEDQVNAFRQFLKDTQNTNSVRVAMSPVPEGVELNAEEMSGKYQGDILLDDFQIESMVSEYAAGRNAYTWPNTKWPQDTVVWEFGEGEFGPLQQAAIEEGIKDIESHSCIRFRRRNQESNYVRLTGGSGGCYANVGYWASRGVHTLNLARNTPGLGCFRHTTIVHEWLHILGFLHMQSTHNRDDYVRIVWENIQQGTENNFAKYEPHLVDNMDLDYDYVSCMHYGAYGFSINGGATIVALQEHEGTMGQREYITEKDWLRLNRHYNCPGAWD